MNEFYSERNNEESSATILRAELASSGIVHWDAAFWPAQSTIPRTWTTMISGALDIPAWQERTSIKTSCLSNESKTLPTAKGVKSGQLALAVPQSEIAGDRYPEAGMKTIDSS
jgi:hypothetical protein